MELKNKADFCHFGTALVADPTCCALRLVVSDVTLAAAAKGELSEDVLEQLAVSDLVRLELVGVKTGETSYLLLARNGSSFCGVRNAEELVTLVYNTSTGAFTLAADTFTSGAASPDPSPVQPTPAPIVVYVGRGSMDGGQHSLSLSQFPEDFWARRFEAIGIETPALALSNATDYEWVRLKRTQTSNSGNNIDLYYGANDDPDKWELDVYMERVGDDEYILLSVDYQKQD